MKNNLTKIIRVDEKKNHSYTKIRNELRQYEDAQKPFIVTTIHSPESLSEITGDVDWKLPAIVMDGAGLYDMKNREFLLIYQMSPAQARRLAKFLDEVQIPYSVNLIDNNQMTVCSGSEYPATKSIVSFSVLMKKNDADWLYQKMHRQDWINEYKVLMYDSADHPGDTYIKIYQKSATVECMLRNVEAMYEIKSF